MKFTEALPRMEAGEILIVDDSQVTIRNGSLVIRNKEEGLIWLVSSESYNRLTDMDFTPISIPEKKKWLMVQADFPAVVWIKTISSHIDQIHGWAQGGKVWDGYIYRSIQEMHKMGWKWAETHSPKEWKSFEIES